MSNDVDNALQIVRSLGDVFHPGDYWTHYKGGVYKIMALAVNENTAEPVVVYQSCKHDTIWVRPLSNWSEDVQLSTGVVKRFKPGAP